MREKLFKIDCKKLFLVIILLGISVWMTIAGYSKLEKNEKVAELEQSIFMCQSSLEELSRDIQKGRDYIAFLPKDRVSRMYYNKEQLQNLYGDDVTSVLYHGRPSLNYLEDLYQFVITDNFEDIDAFEVCTDPFLQVDFDGNLWQFLEQLDEYLETDNGAKAYAALNGDDRKSEVHFISYCCKYAYLTNRPCAHGHRLLDSE